MNRTSQSRWWSAAVLLAALAVAGGVYASNALVPHPSEMMPRAVDAILLRAVDTGMTLVAVGERGHVLLSTDGQSWTQMPAPVSAMLNNVKFLDAKIGWAVGYDAAILKTEDGGHSWKLQNYQPDPGLPFLDVLFLNAQRGFAVGARGMMKRSSDGGTTWTDVQGDFIDLGLNLNAIVKLKDGALLVAGEKGLLLRSTDDGASWQMLKSPSAGSFFGALPEGESGVLLHGLRGNVYVASNLRGVPAQDPKAWDEFSIQSVTDAAALAAAGWRLFDNPGHQSLFGSAELDEQHAVLVGVNGTVLIADLQAGVLKPLLDTPDMPLAGVLPHGQELLLFGRNGVRHLKRGSAS